MNDKKMIGANIRALRKAFGETGEELGDYIGVTKGAISNYENGEREQNRDILEGIAKHYMISVENLLYYDYSDMNKITINGKLFWERLDTILPIFYSEYSLENIHFKRAYKNQERLYEEFREGNMNNINRLYEICLTEYEKAFEEKKTNETVANILSIIFLLSFGVQVLVSMHENKNTVIMKILTRDYGSGLIEDIESISEDEIDEMKKSLQDPELLKSIDEYIKNLRCYAEWSDLAYYYLALKYVFNINDNDVKRERNNTIGFEMLRAFDAVGNEYAGNYLKYSIDALR